MLKLTALTLALLASTFSAVASAKPKSKPTTYESKGAVYSVGETIRVVGDRKKAELDALRVAIAKLAEALEKKGHGKRDDLATGIENAVTQEQDLAAFKLGKVKIESVMQSRWESPEGKDAWTTKVKVSVRFK